MRRQKPWYGPRRRDGARWIGAGLIALALIFSVSIVGPGVVAMFAADTWQPFPTIEEALRQGALSRGAVYAGDCAKTRSPQDLGKVCSKYVGEHGTMRAYLVGRTFSEYRFWVIVQQTEEGWRIVNLARYDGTSRDSAVPWP